MEDLLICNLHMSLFTWGSEVDSLRGFKTNRRKGTDTRITLFYLHPLGRSDSSCALSEGDLLALGEGSHNLEGEKRTGWLLRYETTLEGATNNRDHVYNSKLTSWFIGTNWDEWPHSDPWGTYFQEANIVKLAYDVDSREEENLVLMGGVPYEYMWTDFASALRTFPILLVYENTPLPSAPAWNILKLSCSSMPEPLPINPPGMIILSHGRLLVSLAKRSAAPTTTVLPVNTVLFQVAVGCNRQLVAEWRYSIMENVYGRIGGCPLKRGD